MKRINKEIYEIKENYKNIDDNVNIYIEVYLPDNYINEPLDIIYLHGVINETEIFERVIDNYFLSVNLNKILVRLVYKYNEIISDYIKNIIVNYNLGMSLAESISEYGSAKLKKTMAIFATKN